jgi:hypothetical protein
VPGLILCLLGWAVVLEKSVGAPRVTKDGVTVPRVRARPGSGLAQAVEDLAVEQLVPEPGR